MWNFYLSKSSLSIIFSISNINYCIFLIVFHYSKVITSPTFTSGTKPSTCNSPGRFALVSPSNFIVQCPKSFNVLSATFPTAVTLNFLSPIVNTSPTTMSSFNSVTVCAIDMSFKSGS